MGLLDVLNGMQNGPRGPSNPSAQVQRRNVADDHGDPRPARLQGGQASHRRPAGRNSGTGAHTGHLARNAGGRRRGRRSRRSAPGRIGRPAGRRRRGQRDQRRARRPAQAIPAERPRRNRQFMGRARARTSRLRRGDLASALGADQINSLMSQSGLSRDELLVGPQPAFARRGQPSDAGRTAADRKRTVGPALMPSHHRFLRPCFFRKGRQP